MDSWIGTISFLETQSIEFFFVIIGFIINAFLKKWFYVSFNSGILYIVQIVLVVFLSFSLSLLRKLLLCFVFDEVYCLINLFIVDNFV
jgi:hypothetical protein